MFESFHHHTIGLYVLGCCMQHVPMLSEDTSTPGEFLGRSLGQRIQGDSIAPVAGCELADAARLFRFGAVRDSTRCTAEQVAPVDLVLHRSLGSPRRTASVTFRTQHLAGE